MSPAALTKLRFSLERGSLVQKPEVKLQGKILAAKDFQLDAAHGCATQALPEVCGLVWSCVNLRR